MEEVATEIVLPQELVRDLPQRTRNGLEALAKHPNGLLTNELKELLKVKSPYYSCFGKKELVAKYGFEVICKPYHDGLQSLWKLQKIQPKNEIPPVNKFWFFDCQDIRKEVLNIDMISLCCAVAPVGSDLDAIRNDPHYFESKEEALKAMGTKYIEVSTREFR